MTNTKKIYNKIKRMEKEFGYPSCNFTIYYISKYRILGKEEAKTLEDIHCKIHRRLKKGLCVKVYASIDNNFEYFNATNFKNYLDTLYQFDVNISKIPKFFVKKGWNW